MNPMQDDVRLFHEAMGVPHPDEPVVLPPERAELRYALIHEELAEYKQALDDQDYISQIDALCDLLYVTFGAAVEMGINVQPFFDEVQRSNMMKVGGARRADGKILKPEGWAPPDLLSVHRAVHGELPR